MQKLFSSIGQQTAGSCRCASCLSTNASAVARQVGSRAAREVWGSRFPTSSTLIYSGIFAAAATFDARQKRQRRDEWEKAIADLKEQVVAKRSEQEKRGVLTHEQAEESSQLLGETKTEPEDVGYTTVVVGLRNKKDDLQEDEDPLIRRVLSLRSSPPLQREHLQEANDPGFRRDAIHLTHLADTGYREHGARDGAGGKEARGRRMQAKASQIDEDPDARRTYTIPRPAMSEPKYIPMPPLMETLKEQNVESISGESTRMGGGVSEFRDAENTMPTASLPLPENLQEYGLGPWGSDLVLDPSDSEAVSREEMIETLLETVNSLPADSQEYELGSWGSHHVPRYVDLGSMTTQTSDSLELPYETMIYRTDHLRDSSSEVTAMQMGEIPLGSATMQTKEVGKIPFGVTTLPTDCSPEHGVEDTTCAALDAQIEDLQRNHADSMRADHESTLIDSDFSAESTSMRRDGLKNVAATSTHIAVDTDRHTDGAMEAAGEMLGAARTHETTPELESMVYRPFPQRWPSNTGSPLRRWHLAPESVYASEERKSKHDSRAWTAKKLEIINISTDLLHTYMVARLAKMPWQEAPPQDPFIRDALGLDRTDLERSITDLHVDLRRAWKAKADLSDYAWPSPSVRLRRYRYGSDERGMCHIPHEMNEDLYEDLKRPVQRAVDRARVLGEVCSTLGRYSTPPNLDTYNILISGLSNCGFDGLATMATTTLRRCQLRPNEASLVAAFSHALRIDEPHLFRRWLEIMRGRKGGLSLAKEGMAILKDPNFDGRLVRKEGMEPKTLQLPHPTPQVMTWMVTGVLRYSGFDTAVEACKVLGKEGWGLSMEGMGVLIRDCVRRVDWNNGHGLIKLVKALEVKAKELVRFRPEKPEQIPIPVFASMLNLCRAAKMDGVHGEVWKHALSVYGGRQMASIERYMQDQLDEDGKRCEIDKTNRMTWSREDVLSILKVVRPPPVPEDAVCVPDEAWRQDEQKLVPDQESRGELEWPADAQDHRLNPVDTESSADSMSDTALQSITA